MAKLLIIAVGVFAMAALIYTENIDNKIEELVRTENEISTAQIGIPTADLLRALEDQMPDTVSGRAAGIFNLTAYLTTNPQNSTALTFVPLITILLAMAGIQI